MADIWKAVTPYVVVDLVCLALVLAIPALATVIPSLMGMK
jgi:TRAP-type C4-dicarboxylate transport system permease large subunit